MFGLIRKRDIAGGQFTYGEYLRLVQIFSKDTLSDIEICKEVIECLHNKRVGLFSAIYLLPYCKEINEALLQWIEREKRECYVPPTSDQIAAGIDRMNKEIGVIGGVISIAEQFGWSFEHIYAMPYTDVFVINKRNAAVSRYQRREQQIIMRKR
jgi:hypothetical protein